MLAVPLQLLLLLLASVLHHAYAQQLHCGRSTYSASDLPSLELPDEGSYIAQVRQAEDRAAVIQDVALSGEVNTPKVLKKMFMGKLTLEQLTHLMHDNRVDFVECDGVVNIAKKREL